MHLRVYAYSLLYRKLFSLLIKAVQVSCLTDIQLNVALSLAFALTYALTSWVTTQTPHRSSLYHPLSFLLRFQILLCIKAKSSLFVFFFALWAGHLFPKPKVISLLQQGEDPWKVEKESPGGSSLGEWVGNLCKQQSGKWVGVWLEDVGQGSFSGFSVLKKW